MTRVAPISKLADKPITDRSASNYRLSRSIGRRSVTVIRGAGRPVPGRVSGNRPDIIVYIVSLGLVGTLLFIYLFECQDNRNYSFIIKWKIFGYALEIETFCCFDFLQFKVIRTLMENREKV